MQKLSQLFHEIATEAESKALRELAAKLGCTEDEAIIIAVKQMFLNNVHPVEGDHSFTEDLGDDIEVERAFERHGRRIGKITYLNMPEDFIQRVEQRIAEGIPLPHEDDESLECFLLFRFLTEDQQSQVKARHDPLEKRHLIARFLEEIEDLESDRAGQSA